MSDIKKINPSSGLPEDKYSIKSKFLNFFLLAMFTIFPLFYTDYYYNIRHDKYYFFLTAAAVLAIMITAVVITNSDTPARSGDSAKAVPWYKRLSLTDYAFGAFIAVCAVSTVFSQDPADAFFGLSGRNNGLLLMIFYAVVYFMITRFFRFKSYVFVALAVCSVAIYLLDILNCFYIDPLGMFKSLTDEQTIANFTSTIGNKNLMSSFICIVLPVTIALSVTSEKRSHRIVYYISSAFGYMALMTADSYSGILGLGAVFAVLLLWFSRRISRLKRFFLAVTIMLLSGKILRLFSLCMGDNSKGISEFYSLLVYSDIIWAVIAVCAVITAILFFADYKTPGKILPLAVPVILGVIFALCVAGIIFAVYYFSVIDTKTNLGFLKSFLRFNDSWGTHRGYMWIRSFWIFGDFSIYNKLFGSGPDTFATVFEPYFEGLMHYGDSYTNCAHNEYINYLITTGIFGLASYLTIIFGALKGAIKSAAKNPIAIAFSASVISYAAQAVVNLAQPITTPLFIIFVALCEAVARQQKSE